MSLKFYDKGYFFFLRFSDTKVYYVNDLNNADKMIWAKHWIQDGLEKIEQTRTLRTDGHPAMDDWLATKDSEWAKSKKFRTKTADRH